MARDPQIGTCPHTAFDSKVAIARLEGSGPTRFMAEVRIRCVDCDEPFQFLGMQPGLHLAGASVSLDGEEAQLAIAPTRSTESPFDRMQRLVAGAQLQ